MAAENNANRLAPSGPLRSTTLGDLPDRLKRRYYVEIHGQEQRLYVDAKSPAPAFRDRGRTLVSARSDERVVRDMVAIAVHRGWETIEARGAAAFRREAWLAGRSAGLGMRGWRPSQRDLQELDRRQRRTEPDRDHDRRPERDRADLAAEERLSVVDAVLRARIANAEVRDQIMRRAREQVTAWLERGASFRSWRSAPEPPERTSSPTDRLRPH